MSQHKGPPELCLDCAADRLKAIEVDKASDAFVRDHPEAAADVREYFRRDRLIELEEADPDVAETAWAIIAHHHQHRTAG